MSVSLAASPFHDSNSAHGCLGVHRGALDQTLVTTEPPPKVMERVRQVLDSMGVAVETESEFRYRCIIRQQMKHSRSAYDLRTAINPSVSGGGIDEVRFSVEVTRLDGLHNTFSLDVRRLKGNLRSYQSLYETIRQRAAEWL